MKLEALSSHVCRHLFQNPQVFYSRKKHFSPLLLSFGPWQPLDWVGASRFLHIPDPRKPFRLVVIQQLFTCLIRSPTSVNCPSVEMFFYWFLFHILFIIIYLWMEYFKSALTVVSYECFQCYTVNATVGDIHSLKYACTWRLPLPLPPPPSLIHRHTRMHTHTRTRAQSTHQTAILQQGCFWSWEMSACWEGVGGGGRGGALYSD